MTLSELAEGIGWVLIYAFVFFFVGPKLADKFLKDALLISAERKRRKIIANSFPKRKLRHPVKMRIKYLTVRVQRMSGWGIDQMLIPSDKRTDI